MKLEGKENVRQDCDALGSVARTEIKDCLPFSQKRNRNNALDGNDKLFHGGCRRKCKRKAWSCVEKTGVEKTGCLFTIRIRDGHFDMRENKRTSSPEAHRTWSSVRQPHSTR